MHALPAATESNGIGLNLRGVRKVFDGGVPAVDGIDLTISHGEFVAILGPSGCGKSTLLRLIAGLDRPTNGVITRDHSRPKADDRSEIAYVFQDAYLLPWRNLLRNVALPLELMGVDKADRLDAARKAIEQVGLADAIRRYPAQLSGGMRMRASLARALVTRPKLLLLDEPFAALDEITRTRLDEQLRQLWMDTGATVLFVTHSVSEAAFLADRAVVLTQRPARTVLDVPIDLPPNRSADLRTDAVFARQMRILTQALMSGGA
jgi:NitT/TauT family transport system ATP-binding protein